LFLAGLILWVLIAFVELGEFSEFPHYDLLIGLLPISLISIHMFYPTTLGWCCSLLFSCFIVRGIFEALFLQPHVNGDQILLGFCLLFAALPLLDKPLKAEPVRPANSPRARG
jgi:hypothetical protein